MCPGWSRRCASPAAEPRRGAGVLVAYTARKERVTVEGANEAHGADRPRRQE